MKSAPATPVHEFAFRLDAHSGVPVYRQLIDQVLAAIATDTLRAGDQLPTVRQVAVDLAINPNTVMRAYREMEIRGVLDTQQGAGTFIAEQKPPPPKAERDRQLAQLVEELVARAGSLGFTLAELLERLQQMHQGAESRRRQS
ncbi:MAG TPA: GntR family transcriptional regulator [Acidobacteriaceae bacterium]|jgi:GntR family transcriptional regulator|nr:GntR family transcriptional regulator [Acidobacteriaceae bacterium]